MKTAILFNDGTRIIYHWDNYIVTEGFDNDIFAARTKEMSLGEALTYLDEWKVILNMPKTYSEAA